MRTWRAIELRRRAVGVATWKQWRRDADLPTRRYGDMELRRYAACVIRGERLVERNDAECSCDPLTLREKRFHRSGDSALAPELPALSDTELYATWAHPVRSALKRS